MLSMAQPGSRPEPQPRDGLPGPVPLVEHGWMVVAGRRVSVTVAELGLACCGVEVREARRREVARQSGAEVARDELAGAAEVAGDGLPGAAGAGALTGLPGDGGPGVALLGAGLAGDAMIGDELAGAAGLGALPGLPGDGPGGLDALSETWAGPGELPCIGAELHVLVVAGTVTTRLAPALREALEQLPQPRAVLAFGACAATGGPYWDSYSVLPGAHEVIDVDGWVPGCPPRPEDLRGGLEAVVRGRL